VPRRHDKTAWKKRKFKGQRRVPEFDGRGLLTKLKKESGAAARATERKT
jgi:hypothetical protein